MNTMYKLKVKMLLQNCYFLLLLYVQMHRLNFQVYSHWLILFLCCDSIISYPSVILLRYLILLLFLCNIIIDNGVDKHLSKTALLSCKHKRKGLYVPMPGVHLGIWIQELAEASSMLVHICPGGILSE